ncbi:MAG TPA: hypothetical protein VKU39_09250, partial [Streptosporangiaceae bacterium]|nr:hypothetical protein [Streptosporangiaceae bacterium]
MNAIDARLARIRGRATARSHNARMDGVPRREPLALASDVQVVDATYSPECLNTCEMCMFCRAEVQGADGRTRQGGPGRTRRRRAHRHRAEPSGVTRVFPEPGGDVARALCRRVSCSGAGTGGHVCSPYTHLRGSGLHA